LEDVEKVFGKTRPLTLDDLRSLGKNNVEILSFFQAVDAGAEIEQSLIILAYALAKK
jgi:hypothetical protein